MKKSNFLLEALEKPFLTRPSRDEHMSSLPSIENIEHSLEDDIPTGFFDSSETNMYSGTGTKKQQRITEQNELIRTYRRIANYAEVADAVSEIVDEAIFSPGSSDIIMMDFGKDIPDSIKEKFSEELKDICNRINLDKNIYSMFSTFYIDGQLNVHCAYDDTDMGGGIQRLSVISPFGLAFNYTKDRWEYTEITTGYQTSSSTVGDKYFDREEVIRIDSGLYSDNLIISNLHTAVKPANMLQTLEDMLIPMRFTRSVSRRVFNVDVSNLNNKKAEEVMKKNQAKFKYKKFYDLNTGTISNQQHISALTEDYWFPNRGGEKGTTVDTIDETGNLGELGDILYFKRKLYTSLKVPVGRINDEGESSSDMDYDTTSINREELKFFNFVSRLRNQFLEVFYELLKRQILSKGIATAVEWVDLLPDFSIKFASENKFFEKMDREKMIQSLSLFDDVKDIVGQYISYEYVFKSVLKMSDDQIREMHDQIEKERSDPLYARFYGKEEEGSSW